jgi:hypothetical protein
METTATATKTVTATGIAPRTVTPPSLVSLSPLSVGQKVRVPYLQILGEIECAFPRDSYYCVLTPSRWPGRICLPRDLIAIRGEVA